MFQRTHLRLTLLNSLVFFVLISVLGTALYSYMHARLYQEVDAALMRVAERIAYGKPWERDVPFLRDPRVFIVIWNEKGEMMDLNRDTTIFTQAHIVPPKQLNELYDMNIENFYFRAIAIQMDTDFGKITVQILRNVNSEREILDQLLLIIVTGCIIGGLCAVAAGYFLAGRALVPIQQAWQKQQQFVSDASHELRTPLAVIQAKTDLLFRSLSATIEEKIVDISVISKECRRLSKLVANLLTLARSDSNQIEIKKEAFRLDELLREIVDHYSEIASYQQKDMTLNVESPILFTADKERIHQLLVILLDNAMKYTEEGGRIHLSCHQTASSITLEVQDNGIGIAKEEIPKIFDRFYQSDKARTKSDGAGLGLSIAKWIIEKHEGKVKVYSQLGEGTRFEITFPKYPKR
ncbi:sensor histidine kinase [Thermaerobacillus caldiproteolyticus]|uniref:sensor histidine kinase n=1 Tax=Thermaerobacillus caldiproteolyticus TaxID=247480 RepID=UPI00188C7F7E|nr:HAMP domain-containing sensor histidine kinase [Anoxybacillus caldiproteolyticus]QPA31476.1 HAMP domain-containing histidine kinase [Anoxybacillus caldiproteolyticus]